MHMFKEVKTGVSMYWIGNWAWSILYIISFLDIDMMANLGIGIWNWIGVLSEVMHIFKDIKSGVFLAYNGKSRSHPIC